MELVDITSVADLSKGDTIVITGDTYINRVKRIKRINITDDGTEIIFGKKKNQFFNLNWYLTGRSWVTECKKLI